VIKCNNVRQIMQPRVPKTQIPSMASELKTNVSLLVVRIYLLVRFALRFNISLIFRGFPLLNKLVSVLLKLFLTLKVTGNRLLWPTKPRFLIHSHAFYCSC
jgi:hypothetical protein